ncbi:hypothetical protein ACHAPJ_011934 [Fusarium lateritium]
MTSKNELFVAAESLRKTELSYTHMKDDKSLPDAFHEAARATKLALQALEVISHPGNEPNNYSSRTGLNNTLTLCGRNSHTLMETISTLATQKGTSRLEDYTKLVQVQGREPVEVLASKILVNVLNAIANLPSSSESQKLVQEMKDAIERLNKLKLSVYPYDSVHNTQVGKASNQFNNWTGTQNNNTGMGTQYNANNDINFGR